LKKIALIDNYDSFTYNLVHLLEKVCDCRVDVFLNDKIKTDDLNSYDNFVLSPGPGLPKDAGITPEVFQKFHADKNILGVCLGMQAIGEFFHSPLKNLDTVMHGIATEIAHKGNDFLFKDIPAKFKVGRYHSWVIDKRKMSDELEILATDEQGEIMALKHRKFKIRGVQFHPESILSEYGETLMKNWTDSIV
jgi:anthranilate synthase component 2